MTPRTDALTIAVDLARWAHHRCVDEAEATWVFRPVWIYGQPTPYFYDCRIFSVWRCHRDEHRTVNDLKPSARRLAVVLAADPYSKHFGHEMLRAIRPRRYQWVVPMYRHLDRWMETGWLEDGWETPAETEGRRPPRRWYRLTDEGRRALTQADEP